MCKWVLGFGLLICTVAHATEAKTFVVIPSGAATIDPKTDHFSIVFEAGWLSKKDNVFQKIVQKSTKLTAEADATSTFFDVASPVQIARVFENQDIGDSLDRPWGGSNLVVVAGYPADTAVKLNAKATVYNDDRFNDLLQTFQKNEPSSGIDVAAELGYANLADALFTDLFDTTKTKVPFTMEVDVQPAGLFQEYYVIGVAPNRDKDDPLLDSMGSNPNLITYSEAGGALSYNGQLIKDHSWVVFKVKKATLPNIVQLGFASGQAPWAVLASNDFYLAPLPDIKTADDAHKEDNAVRSQLGSELTLLKNELSFSAYDRAVALAAFAQQSRANILAACQEGSVTTAACTTPSIDTFTHNITGIFGLAPAEHGAVDAGGQKLNNSIRSQLKLE